MSQVWGENGEDGYGFNVGLIIFVYEQGFKDYKDYIDYYPFYDSPILHWDYSIRCLCVVYGFLVLCIRRDGAFDISKVPPI